MGPRVGLIVNLGDVLKIDMSIDLGGLDIGMPQEFLHRSNITARFQQMASEGVTQHVWVHVGKSLPLGPQPHSLLDSPRSKPPAVACNKNCVLIICHKLCAALKPCVQCISRVTSHWYQPLFISLSDYPYW